MYVYFRWFDWRHSGRRKGHNNNRINCGRIRGVNGIHIILVLFKNHLRRNDVGIYQFCSGLVGGFLGGAAGQVAESMATILGALVLGAGTAV